MFGFRHRIGLALGDSLRRAGFQAAAGGLLLVGAGFLTAALWSWLAHGLGWGAIHASLAIGLAFMFIGLLILALGGQRRHRMPTKDELRQEVEMQVGLVADVAAAQARKQAYRLVGKAKSRAKAFARGDRERTEKEEKAVGSETKGNPGKKGSTANKVMLLAAFAAGAALATRMSKRRSTDTPDDGAPDEGDATDQS